MKINLPYFLAYLSPTGLSVEEVIKTLTQTVMVLSSLNFVDMALRTSKEEDLLSALDINRFIAKLWVAL